MKLVDLRGKVAIVTGESGGVGLIVGICLDRQWPARCPRWKIQCGPQ